MLHATCIWRLLLVTFPSHPSSKLKAVYRGHFMWSTKYPWKVGWDNLSVKVIQWVSWLIWVLNQCGLYSLHHTESTNPSNEQKANSWKLKWRLLDKCNLFFLERKTPCKEFSPYFNLPNFQSANMKLTCREAEEQPPPLLLFPIDLEKKCLLSWAFFSTVLLFKVAHLLAFCSAPKS